MVYSGVYYWKRRPMMMIGKPSLELSQETPGFSSRVCSNSHDLTGKCTVSVTIGIYILKGIHACSCYVRKIRTCLQIKTVPIYRNNRFLALSLS